MSFAGLQSLRDQVNQQQQVIQELQTKVARPSGDTSTLSSNSQPSFTSSVLQIKNKLDSSKIAQSQQTMDTLFNDYQDGLPDITDDFSELGTLIEYSVDFVEQHAPTLMQVLEIAATDTSPFKLETCITLILLVLPPAIMITKTIIEDLINMVVKLKNDIKEVIDKPTIVQQPEPKKKGLLAKLIKK